MTDKHKMIGAKQISFGGSKGDYSQIGDTGGQDIIFWSSVIIDAIQIGDTKYGGDGGDKSGSWVLPQDGAFIIKKLHARDCDGSEVLCYFEAKINGIEVKVGDPGQGEVFLDFGEIGVKVKFAGVYAGWYIDSLVFERV